MEDGRYRLELRARLELVELIESRREDEGGHGRPHRACQRPRIGGGIAGSRPAMHNALRGRASGRDRS